MPQIRFHPLPTATATALRQGAPDANGQRPEQHLSDSAGNPCRHCLCFIPAGAPMLILSYRPFASLHPYAETGPIFLCAQDCAPWTGPGLPPILTDSPDFLLKGYRADERIAYGTGRVVPKADLAAYGEALLARDDIAFVDVRSARNNCFQVRITRA
ncbi:MAG: hypothetical protein RIT14_1894 [Pseudomonadota bacterium]